MEGSTVSPPPASPTEGDDPCWINATNVAIHSVTLLICLCGLAGNSAVLWLNVLNDLTSYIFDLAVADFLFLLFALPSTLLFLLEDVSCSTLMPLVYLSFLFQLPLFSFNWGLLRLTRISILRCKSIECPRSHRCRFPRRLWWVAGSTMYWAFFAIVTVIPIVTFLCQSQKHEHCRLTLISMYTLNFLIFAPSIVISTTILFNNVKCGSHQQQPKRLDIVIFLTVVVTLLLGLWNALEQLGYTILSSQVAFLLNYINSSIKPFIYFSVGSSWSQCSVRGCWRHCSVGSLRNSLQRVFEEPEENTPSSNDAAMDTLISPC